MPSPEELQEQIDLEAHRELLDQALERLPDEVEAMLLYERLAALGVDDGEAPVAAGLADPAYAASVLEELIREQKENKHIKASAKPTYRQQLLEMMQDRPVDGVSYEDYVDLFRGKEQVTDPAGFARRNLSFVNEDLFPQGLRIGRYQDHLFLFAYVGIEPVAE